MTTTTANHFDALGYVKKSRELGVPEQIAEYQARQIEQSIDIAVNAARAEIENKDLATKKDIESVRKEIALSSNKTIIWIGGLLLASGLIQHFFK
jgi:hypothetical protein